MFNIEEASESLSQVTEAPRQMQESEPTSYLGSRDPQEHSDRAPFFEWLKRRPHEDHITSLDIVTATAKYLKKRCDKRGRHGWVNLKSEDGRNQKKSMTVRSNFFLKRAEEDSSGLNRMLDEEAPPFVGGMENLDGLCDRISIRLSVDPVQDAYTHR